ncbi:MAG: site-specific DNA-methyltransferase [Phycisphaerae bacterium]|nr:site-specific DNA-methyltransferase [Phycisphaerae bacterium]
MADVDRDRRARAMDCVDTVITGDCVAWLNAQSEALADLIFADPPFNIGYKYDLYEDRRKYDEYRTWTRQWMIACKRVLKPTGSLWVAIGDDYAAEVRLIGRELGLCLRNWVIWHYTFGQNTQRKFARSHTHLFYWTADPKAFTFSDASVRIPSARQTTYADRRANPAGKLPDDVWSFSRVCGTFHERAAWHPCQMPEKVLERIVLACSKVGDLVLDPFSGSGTTCVVAARLGRHYLGIELSEDYARQSRIRIADTLAGRRRTTDIAENPQALRAHRRGSRARRTGRLLPRMGRRLSPGEGEG